MDWGWAVPFAAGVLVGVALMWGAVVVSQARDAEQERQRDRDTFRY